MRVVKFREPMNCQNGHFRWLYKTRLANRIDDFQAEWGPKHPECKCPTGDIGQGFTNIGSDDEFSGLTDKTGKEIYENDIVKLGPCAVARYLVEFRNGIFGVQTDPVFVPLGLYPEREVLFNANENIEMLEALIKDIESDKIEVR